MLLMVLVLCDLKHNPLEKTVKNSSSSNSNSNSSSSNCNNSSSNCDSKNSLY